MVDGLAENTIAELRQLWVTASGDSITADILRARSLAETVPLCRRSEANDFVVALERLEHWLRDC